MLVITVNVNPPEIYPSPELIVKWNIRSPETFLDLLQRELQGNIADTKFSEYKIGAGMVAFSGEKILLTQPDFRLLYLAQGLNNHHLALCETTTAYGMNNDNTPIMTEFYDFICIIIAGNYMIHYLY